MDDDAQEIADVRAALRAAENAGDTEGLLALLARDVVAMVPSAPVLEGWDACAGFVRSALAGLLSYFERKVEYVSAEVAVLGDVAYDRGTFSVTTARRDGGDRDQATGKYFWLLRRDGGGAWRIARLIHCLDEEGEAGTGIAPLELETPRLRLSCPRPADAQEIFERYASDPDVTRYLSWPRHQSVADTKAFIAFSDAEWARAAAGPYLIRSRETGQLLGSTGLTFEAPDKATTGYVLAKDAWGQGHATEALQAMVGLARQLGVLRLSALCHPDHRTSQRVLEKCGFARDESFSRQAAFPNLAAGAEQDVWRYVLAVPISAPQESQPSSGDGPPPPAR
jgi:ribosomal-protein-alanine N-acetyltransferase